MTGVRIPLGAAAAAVLGSVLLFAPPAHAVDARAEATAKAALKKAVNDFDGKDYMTALARLDGAARGCDAGGCSPTTKALVLRDLGTMQFRAGDPTSAARSFAAALKIVPDLALRGKYVAPDVRAAWDRAKSATAAARPAEPAAPAPPAKAPAPPEQVEQPSGDFTHTPAPEQEAGVPLPIYAEYPGTPAAARVVVRYKGASMSDWARVDLTRAGAGWEGTLPCKDVTLGTMRYWLQGFDRDGVPVANSGDTKHPFSVPIRTGLSGEAPHLPGKPPPHKCSDGDGAVAEAAAAPAAGEDAGGDEGTPAPAAAPGQVDDDAYAHLWVGASVTVDILSMPSGTDVCSLTRGGVPANASNLYCTNPDGTDFPSRSSPQQNAELSPGNAGQSGGGLLAGDVRVMLNVDYAIFPNLLVGGRMGYVANSYPGSVAVKDGRAAGFKIDVEARATYLFGDTPLAHIGFLPVVFAGFGAAEFDGHTPTLVTLNNVAGQQPVDVWRTDGPFFVMAGGGARYQFSRRVAFTGAARLNLAVGNGVLVTFGPEVSVGYGF